MIIEIRKEVLLKFLEKLYCHGNTAAPLITDIVIVFEDGCLKSIQMDKKKRFLRWVKLPVDKFEIKHPVKKKLMIDKEIEKLSRYRKPKKYYLRKKVQKIVECFPAKSYLTFNFKSNGLYKISDDFNNTEHSVHYEVKEEEIYLPFKMKKGLPYLKKEKVSLDNHIILLKNSIEDISNYLCGSKTKLKLIMNHEERTPFFKIDLGDREHIEYKPSSFRVYKSNEDIEIEFNFNIKKILKTFKSDVEIFCRNGFPVIIQDTNREFGVMVNLEDNKLFNKT